MSVLGRQFDQQEFPGMPAREEQHPGTLSITSWASRPDLVYHGTFREQKPDVDFRFKGMHVGTREAASYRLDALADYGKAHEPGTTDRGRVYPLRMTTDQVGIKTEGSGDGVRFGDTEVNAAVYHLEAGGTPSLSAGARQAHRYLDSGMTIAYRNAVEDAGSTSFILGGRGHARLWSEDVMEAKAKGLPVNPAHERAILGGFEATSGIQHGGRTTGVMGGPTKNPEQRSLPGIEVYLRDPKLGEKVAAYGDPSNADYAESERIAPLQPAHAPVDAGAILRRRERVV